MSISAVTASNPNSPVEQKATAQMQQAARQFEAILLMQLTSALSGTNNDGEDSLFGGDSGTGLAKQMFAEQMATTLSESGGVGLADLIMNQFQGGKTKPAESFKENMKTAIAAVRETKTDAPQNSSNQPALKNLSSLNAVTPPKYGSNKLSSDDIIFGTPENAAVESATNYSTKNSALSSSGGFEIVSQAEMDEDAAASNAFVASVARKTLAENGVKIDPKLNRRDERLQAIFNEITSSSNAPAENLFRATRPRIVADPVGGGEITPTPSSRKNLQTEAVDASPAAASVVNFQSPVEGKFRSGFGNRVHPIDRTVKFHKGIDIAAPRGTPINAAAEGKVVFAGWGKGYGNMVVIEHADGRQTRYAHADKLFVTEGDVVESGQNIAAVGSTGKSTGPHLHFEILENGRQINPLNFLSKDF